ncbi:ArsA-related P-loop ATPase [uncultured Streptomyces sp.]|uniref:ArsA family ATPase n=1 Tax=uncultured Streptomyces sp. TaxID=174707 RepID=UPI00261227FE|nr:ArsA-related P-loop ATPase [uncultured Streptomyces sp.]
MRTVLVTGPGGGGAGTVAAATALAAARSGRRTLLITGTAVPGFPATPEPAPAAEHLDHVVTDSGAHLRDELLALQERASGVLDLLGAGRLDAEEMTGLPGGDRFALLHCLHRAAVGDWAGYDTLVVALPPLPDAVALLALPAHLRRLLRRLLPEERLAARALRPVLAQLAGVPAPARWLYDAAARKDAELAAVQGLLADRATTVRLVAEPGPAADDDLRDARTGLALHGVTVDALLAARVLPRHSADPWFAALAAGQGKSLDRWRTEWTGTPLHEVPHLGRDPRTPDDLELLGVPAPDDREPGPAGPPWWIEESGPDAAGSPGGPVWCLPLPGAVKADLRLVRRGDELLLTAGRHHRAVTLESGLRRCTVSGAALTDGVLRVRFTPDPALWPRTP